ncbi:MAG: hypothetical protein MJ252_24385, partial [archaeon]|nr:hypothetical protein [archaeon]
MKPIGEESEKPKIKGKKVKHQKSPEETFIRCLEENCPCIPRIQINNTENVVSTCSITGSTIANQSYEDYLRRIKSIKKSVNHIYYCYSCFKIYEENPYNRGNCEEHETIEINEEEGINLKIIYCRTCDIILSSKDETKAMEHKTHCLIGDINSIKVLKEYYEKNPKGKIEPPLTPEIFSKLKNKLSKAKENFKKIRVSGIEWLRQVDPEKEPLD